MKFKLRKLAIPVIIAGVIIYGGSKIGRINHNEDYKNNTNQVEEKIDIDEIITEQGEIDMDKIDKVEEPVIEEKPTEEVIEVRKVDGTEIQTKKVVKATSAVNVRSGMTTDSDKLAVLNAGDSVDFSSDENEGWYTVNYDGKTAYVSKDYSTVTEETKVVAPLQKMVYFKNSSNLYKDSKSNESIGDIPELEAAAIYGESNGLYLASVDNKVGYIKPEDTGDLKDTFVIVDISDQQAYLYEGNELVVQTPIVSGRNSSPTTKGLHEVWYIENNRFLKGDGYNVYVDYFMAFHGGEGLHDAEYHTHYNSDGSIAFSHGWRSKNAFGGELYKNGGSHGCVNMPNEATKIMSDHIEIGDKVLVKQ
ncbi:MAG: L,D-transpeptidase family protein [Bacilli bacterium]|nr:L,D-transpeptidase family protein [Bacilli bacterium]